MSDCPHNRYGYGDDDILRCFICGKDLRFYAAESIAAKWEAYVTAIAAENMRLADAEKAVPPAGDMRNTPADPNEWPYSSGSGS